MHTHTYTHTYIHTYVRTYVRTYIHTYMHTRIQHTVRETPYEETRNLESESNSFLSVERVDFLSAPYKLLEQRFHNSEIFILRG